MSSHSFIPPQFQECARETANVVSGLDNVLIAAHVNMDGDALGSISACGHMLGAQGRKFALYSCTGVPAYLDFLPLPGPVYASLAEIPFVPQSAIYLDCSETKRLGHELEDVVSRLPSVNIDHHITEHGMGSLCNFIEPKAAATAQLTAYVALDMGLELTGSLGESIALGLMTDTGGFCHGNTTADVFSLCALLAHNGCSLSDLREKLQNNWRLGRLRLWGEVFTRMNLADNGQIAICGVSLSEMAKYHCQAEDLEGLVEWLRKIRGVKVAALVREETAERCKFSLRSHGAVDVRAMAVELGGGGHRNAAGGLLCASLDIAREKLLAIISKHLYSQSRA